MKYKGEKIMGSNKQKLQDIDYLKDKVSDEVIC